MNIGEKLKALRKERKLTLEDVSRSLDISRANINKYENGFPLYFNGFEVCRSVPLCSVIDRCYS